MSSFSFNVLILTSILTVKPTTFDHDSTYSKLLWFNHTITFLMHMQHLHISQYINNLYDTLHFHLKNFSKSL